MTIVNTYDTLQWDKMLDPAYSIGKIGENTLLHFYFVCLLFFVHRIFLISAVFELIGLKVQLVKLWSTERGKFEGWGEYVL